MKLKIYPLRLSTSDDCHGLHLASSAEERLKLAALLCKGDAKAYLATERGENPEADEAAETVINLVDGGSFNDAVEAWRGNYTVNGDCRMLFDDPREVEVPLQVFNVVVSFEGEAEPIVVSTHTREAQRKAAVDWAFKYIEELYHGSEHDEPWYNRMAAADEVDDLEDVIRIFNDSDVSDTSPRIRLTEPQHLIS